MRAAMRGCSGWLKNQSTTKWAVNQTRYQRALSISFETRGNTQRQLAVSYPGSQMRANRNLRSCTPSQRETGIRANIPRTTHNFPTRGQTVGSPSCSSLRNLGLLAHLSPGVLPRSGVQLCDSSQPAYMTMTVTTKRTGINEFLSSLPLGLKLLGCVVLSLSLT